MGISPTQLLIILLIVALIFGTKKLRNIGGDLGGAFKNFKKAMSDETSSDGASSQGDTTSELIDAKVEAKSSTSTAATQKTP